MKISRPRSLTKKIWSYLSQLTNFSLLCLFSFSSFLFLYHLNSTHLTNWDEAWHAAIARNIARSGNFISPTYNDQLWFATAPFYLWIVAVWFQLTNYSVVGVRLFSALVGLGTVITTYYIGRRLKDHRTGLIAAFILTTTIQFLFRARQGNLDVPLTFFTTLAIYSFLHARDQPNWYYLFGIFSSLGFLTKSMLGLLPFGLLLLTPPKHWPKPILAFLFVAAPWNMLAYRAYGLAFLNHYYGQYFFTKVTNINPIAGVSYTWYINVLRHGLKVWFLTLPFTLINFITPFKHRHINFQLLLFTLWVFLPLLVLSLSQMKNDWYLISLYPGISLFIAVSMTQISNRNSSTRSNKLLLLLILSSGLLNLTRYWSSFVVPETVAAEVQLCTTAQHASTSTEAVILDDTYHPVASFYTDRHVLPIRYSRAPDALTSDSNLALATHSARLVLTNTQTIDQLLSRLHYPNYQVLDTADDKLLIQLQFPPNH